MELIPVLLVVAAAFGACYGADKLFTKVFRSTQQHKSGKSVRLNKHYGGFGLVLAVFGIANLWLAVFGDVGVAVLAILNAMRALHVERA